MSLCYGHAGGMFKKKSFVGLKIFKVMQAGIKGGHIGPIPVNE